MAAGLDLRPATAALGHPAFAPLRIWLDPLFSAHTWPDVDALNALAGSAGCAAFTASGLPVRFFPPDPADATHYESRIFATGRVDTRSANLHDLFNALAWLAFPGLKAALNARHVAQLPLDGERRGSLRDLLTLVDEGGVLVACTPESLAELEALIRGFHWENLFREQRDKVLRDMRFVLVGHSAYEKALAPYPGITCKAIFVATPRALIQGPVAELVTWLDGRAAEIVMALPQDTTPRQFPPLPVFGYPDWLAESRQDGFYADRRWFRPGSASPTRKLGRSA